MYGHEQPDSGGNHPRNLSVWRSNRLAFRQRPRAAEASGTESGFRARNLRQRRDQTRLVEATAAIEGKPDSLVTLDFRRPRPVLRYRSPTATWYERRYITSICIRLFIRFRGG